MSLAAFVFMPEHVHLLVVPNGREPAINQFLARIKQPFSKWVKRQLTDMKSPLVDRLTVQERPGKTCFRFWQEGPGYDRNLTTPSVIEAAIEYIHMNPVRRGLVKRAVDWKWSSASWYPALSAPTTITGAALHSQVADGHARLELNAQRTGKASGTQTDRLWAEYSRWHSTKGATGFSSESIGI